MRLAALSVVLLVACGPETERTEAPPDAIDFDSSRRGLIDCTERVDTGYVNGDPFPITVVTVDGEPVERETANAYWVMQQAAANDGVLISIVSGFRTYAEQQYLYNCYINCNCNNCNLAARPGYSNHQSGHALDLNTGFAGVLDWLDDNGAAFGFSRTVPSEDWHWEWWGGGPGGGPCGVPACEALPAEGGVIDEAGNCFTAFGPSAFWRSVEGAGWDGALLWTNAFENDRPSNWARWQIELEEPGEYEIEVYLDPAWAVYSAARYEVRHDGGDTTVFIDQSAASGWTSLGAFALSSGASVSVFDNVAAPVEPDQHIAVDALRVIRVRDPGPKPDLPSARAPAADVELLLTARGGALPASLVHDPSNPSDPGAPAIESPMGEVDGGCACSVRASKAAPPAAIVLLLGLLLFRRRRD